MRFNKLFPIFVVLIFSLNLKANEVLKDYKTLSEQFIVDANSIDKTTEDLLPTVIQLKDLGIKILDMYSSANPSCKEQLDIMKAEFLNLKEFDLEKLFDRYHEGIGLPKGPYHCIYGRAYPLHPLMVEVRIHQGWTENLKQDGIADIEEMIKYLPNLEKNLTNPPN